MGKGIFVTGTDTGVGKTIVSASLAKLLKMRGCNVGVMKPVTTGCEMVDGKLVSEDAMLLARAASVAYSDELAPYRFTEPAAPSDAARKEKISIDCSMLVEKYQTLASRHDFMIVEGAGGLMVPLVGGILIADLAKMMELPLLVVARGSLGTINHTLLTCFAASQMELEVKGVIINRFSQTPTFAEKHSPHSIGSLAGAPILGIWGEKAALDEDELVENLAAWLDAQPETDLVLKELGL